MPGQPVGGVHLNVPLSNLAVLYRPLESGFIANEVAPILPVNHESDAYYVFTQGDFYATDVDDLVPDRTEPREIEFSHTTATYQARRRELAWSVSDRERKNADDQLNLERNKQNGTLGRLMLKREVRVAALLRKTTNGGSLTLGANAGNKWDNAATTYQQIYTDIVTGITAMRQAIGLRPNTIVNPAAVAEGMGKSLVFTSAGGPQAVYDGNPDNMPLYTQYPLLPRVLWGMRVLVPGVIQNTATEGQTASYADIWSEQVRLLYVNPAPSIETPSVAYTFRSEELTTRYERREGRRIDWYATGQTIDERVVAASAGYEINDCLT
jgi:hypothetical protein